MALIGLTKEQNEALRKEHVDAVECYEMHMKAFKKAFEDGGKAEFELAKSLAMISYSRARTYWELGNFEQDSRMK